MPPIKFPSGLWLGYAQWNCPLGTTRCTVASSTRPYMVAWSQRWMPNSVESESKWKAESGRCICKRNETDDRKCLVWGRSVCPECLPRADILCSQESLSLDVPWKQTGWECCERHPGCQICLMIILKTHTDLCYEMKRFDSFTYFALVLFYEINFKFCSMLTGFLANYSCCSAECLEKYPILIWACAKVLCVPLSVLLALLPGWHFKCLLRCLRGQ